MIVFGLSTPKFPAVSWSTIAVSFRRCDWLFPPSAREVSPGNRSNYKSTRERVDSKGLYGRWRLHLMGSWVYLLVLETKKKHALFLPFLSPLSPSLSWIKAHTRYIKILTWLSRGFRVKIANFSWFHCLPIPRRDLSTKKTRLNIEKCPESPGVMLEFKYIERGIH